MTDIGILVGAKGLNYNQTYDCGAITFGNYRIEIAKAYNKEMGELYERWYLGFIHKELSEDEIQKLNSYLNEREGIGMFLVCSDENSKFTPKECKQMYDDMKDLKIDMQGHNYGDVRPIIKDGKLTDFDVKTYNMHEQFLNMFQHCYKNRVNLYLS